MKKIKSTRVFLMLIAIVGVSFVVACAPPAGGNTTPPTVISTSPLDSTMDNPLNATINATFSEAMNPGTIETATFTVVAGATALTGTVGYNASTNTATFTPPGNLLPSTKYTATITIGAKDVAGNALAAPMVWTFTTGTTVDTTPPTVVSVVPTDTSTGFAVNGNITATFSEGMDISTINTTDFTVANGTTAVTGTVTYDVPSKTAIFSSASILAYGTAYTATITTGVKDIAGNALATKYVWNFTTLASAGLGPAPVRLGTAGNFAILAKTAITTVPASIITGDIGLSPAAESYMTGFSQTDATGYATSTQVTGHMYAADMTPPTPWKMTTAISDMETAYTDAAGRAQGVGPNLNLGGGTIPLGTTLAPGTYTWGTNVTIPTGVTLSGGANDVWIFQISGTLDLASAQIINVTGGAQAKNVFWQVTDVVTLGTTSVFAGTILGQTQIIVKTGATLLGRALAQSQVTLDTATITP